MYLGQAYNEWVSFTYSKNRKDITFFFYMDRNNSLKIYEKRTCHQDIFNYIKEKILV